MRKSIFAKIGAAAVVLTLVTSSLVGGTFAKYVTNASAKAEGTVAQWNVAFKDSSDVEITDSTSISLVGTGGSDTILPGDSGEFKIKIYGQEAQVGYDYSFKIEPTTADAETNKVTFYTKGADDTQNEITSSGSTAVTVAYDPTDNKTMNKEETIYWKFQENTGADADAEDTKLAGKSVSYKITMTATQHVGE